MVVLLGMIGSAVALLVICGRQLEERRSQPARKADRGAGGNELGSDPEQDPFIGLDDSALLSRSVPIRAVRRRASAYSRGIWRHVEAMQNDLTLLRRRLHRYPELAGQEKQTAALIATTLRKLGWEVKAGIAGNGVVALLRMARPGPVVAVRAVMDGAPVAEKPDLEYASRVTAQFMGRRVGVSHAAGHDLEMATVLGVAEVLADLRRRLPGVVKLIFQPASQGVRRSGRGGGARAMIDAGVLADPSVAALFAVKLQPLLRVGQIAIDTSAGGGGVARFTVTLRTPGGATCRRPAPRCPDLISTAAQLVLALRAIPTTRMDAAGRLLVTVGAINGGKTGDLLPATLVIKGTIRWRRVIDRNIAMHLVRRTTQATATLAGASSKVAFQHGGALVGNSPRLARWALGTAVRVLRRRGIKISAVPPLTDPGFDHFRRKVASLLIQLGVTPRGGKRSALGTGDFRPSERAIPVGVHLLTNLIVDYLVDAAGERRPAPPRARPRPAPPGMR